MSVWTRVRVAIAVGVTLAAMACQSSFVPAPEKIPSWTKSLQDTQPDDAFAAVYARHERLLLFVGAKHANRTDSLTFQLINEAFESFKVDTVIVEGFPYSYGVNAEQIMSWVEAQHEIDGLLSGGELVPTVRGARARNAAVWGGEPDDAEIRDRVLAEGFQLQDLLGFYTLRSVPQWIRLRKIDGATDTRTKPLIEAELEHNRSRLAAPAAVLPDYTAWTQWYLQTNRKAFGEAFELEETSPLNDGGYGSNKIAEAISHVRDELLLEIIARHLNAHERVMIVFGASHLMLLRPALTFMLGPPCYQGSNLKFARAQCPSQPD